MRLHSLVSILAVSLFLTGCSAHTQSPTVMNRLQIQVAQLERKVENRDEAIGQLEERVQGLTSELNEIKTYSLYEPIEEFDYRQETADAGQGQEQKPGRLSKEERKIIRVRATVSEVQKALKNAGFYQGNIDGKLGSQSKQAILDFQANKSLKSDGIIGRRTWTALKTYLD